MDTHTDDTTTAHMAAKTLNVSRKTITRMVKDGRLTSNGTDTDGNLLVSMSSLVSLKQQRDTGHKTPGTFPGQVPDVSMPALMEQMLETLRMELEYLHDARDKDQQQLLIAQRSMTTMQDELAESQLQISQARDRAQTLEQFVQDMAGSSPFKRWKAKKHAAKLLADL